MKTGNTNYSVEFNSKSVFDQGQLSTLLQEVCSMASDIRYIKRIVQAKQEKKEAKRERKRQELLAQEEKLEAERERHRYENLVRLLRDRPWQFMPYPPSPFSPREEELVKLLAAGDSDAEITRKMGLKEGSVSPRVSAIYKKLNLKERTEIIDYYHKFVQERKEHRRLRCEVILSWLLDPPPGFFYQYNINAGFTKRPGRSKTYRYAGTFISDEIFRYLKPKVLNAWKLKTKGLSDKDIAAKLKITESTLDMYFSKLRRTIRIVSRVDLRTTEELVERFRKHRLLK